MGSISPDAFPTARWPPCSRQGIQTRPFLQTLLSGQLALLRGHQVSLERQSTTVAKGLGSGIRPLDSHPSVTSH